MNYCSACGASIIVRIPAGDTLPRHCCDTCGQIHYLNPKIVVGCMPEADDGRLLLCRRAIEPRSGFWTMPAGFMENGESVTEAAQRETLEEACARVELLGLSTIASVVRVNQVHMMYRARLLDGEYGVGDESLEVRLFDEADIPWDELAFRSVTAAFKHFLEDRSNGVFSTHHVDLR
ncbi:MAG: NUDIX hydrolase [Gammaproteobacteria bacterium]